jgi:hypothetical protein
MMIDNPFISRAGCTAFGAWGNATENGHLITGRNFDWEAAEVFSRDRVVDHVRAGRRDSVHLAGVGGHGRRRFRHEPRGRFRDHQRRAVQLPRETARRWPSSRGKFCRHAHNLDEALKILRGAKVFVSTIWLWAAAPTGNSSSWKKLPTRPNVREADGDSIVCPNHFETAELAKDGSRNTNYMAEATSVSREAADDGIDPGTNRRQNRPGAGRGFLRDRDLPGGVFAGDGHRGSLNAFIATHAVVMDLTTEFSGPRRRRTNSVNSSRST